MSDERKIVYVLYHIYYVWHKKVKYKEIKRIGFFYTKEDCEKQIEIFIKYKGFKKHPRSCFKIFEYELGKEYWREEFREENTENY